MMWQGRSEKNIILLRNHANREFKQIANSPEIAIDKVRLNNFARLILLKNEEKKNMHYKMKKKESRDWMLKTI